ncbi:hypothetical protein SAMN04489731_11596 [Amycolatopsis regifaucium]|nr:hypothetical protein SAMN04489731_11596 [Amycolatopsis regifaucium]
MWIILVFGLLLTAWEALTSRLDLTLTFMGKRTLSHG